MIAAVILAAGEGRRMGGPKAFLILDGESLLQRTVRVAMAAGCDPVIAVVGDWDPGLLAASVRVVHNREASEGMASSIRAGFAALAPGIESALILTVDQLAVDAALLRKLLALAVDDPDNPVGCAYGNSLGIPAVLPRRLFAELMALQGDRGAKAILLRERTAALPFPEGEADLDSPEDLARIKR
jgi:molybdenum cofactor cytidylyltransferase